MKKIFLFVILLLTISCKENITYSELEIVSFKNNSFEKETIEIVKGNKAEISVNLIMKDGKVNNEIIWESENEKVVKVIQNGIIEAINVGNTRINIYAKNDKNVFTSLKIRVLPPKETTISTNDYSFLNNDNKKENKEIILKGKKIKGYVKDVYGNLIKDIDIRLSYDKKSFNYYSKDGYYYFNDIPEDYLITLEAKKNGFTKRTITEVFKKSNNDFYEVNFDNKYSLKDEPEIIDFSINNKKTSIGTIFKNFDTFDEDIYTSLNFNKLNYLNINFLFSENIDKEHFENSFEVIALKENKEVFFINKSNEKIKFNWLDNLKSLTINLPTKYNSSFGKTIYRIQFRNGISDLQGNLSIKYIFNKNSNNDNAYSGVIFSISN